MKKLLSLMLVAVMLLAAGCGNNEPANTTPGGDSQQKETTTQEQTTREATTPEQTTPEPATTPVDTTAAPTELVTTEPTTLEQTKDESIVDSNLPNVGDIITFGSYPQDADGTVKPIEWIVLAVEDGKALLISRYGLDAQAYNEDKEEVTWETCTLRTWLNEDFYKAAFSKDEQSKIQLTKVENKDNEDYGTPGGNETEDRLFLLSLDEVTEYFVSKDERVCYATKWAVEQGTWVNNTGACIWWLRSPGRNSEDAAYVGSSNVYGDGNYVDSSSVVVRPALWFNPNIEQSLTQPSTTPADTTPEQTTEEATVSGDLPNVGDIVTFGSYPQDADGTVKPIEWIVLAVEDGKALLISRYGLDAKAYDEENGLFTWETCTLRTWLKEDFYKEAFSKDEQNRISLNSMDNKDNEEYWVEAKWQTVPQGGYDYYTSIGYELGQSVVKEVGESFVDENSGETYYKIYVDSYDKVGFIYADLSKDEYEALQKYQNETGIQVIYPMPETYKTEFVAVTSKANLWYELASDETTSNGESKYHDGNGNPIFKANYKTSKKQNYANYDSLRLATDNGGEDGESWFCYAVKSQTGYTVRLLYREYFYFNNGFYATNLAAGGDDTEDKIFLLSLDEVETLFASKQDRICYPTEWASENCYIHIFPDEACLWWLRSGNISRYAAFVGDDGITYIEYSKYNLRDFVNYNYVVVRPALWIDLSSLNAE